MYDVGDLEQIRKYNNLGLDDEGRITHFEEKPQTPVSTVTAIALYHYPRAVLPWLHRYLAEEKSRPTRSSRRVAVSPDPCYPIASRESGSTLAAAKPTTRPSACSNPPKGARHDHDTPNVDATFYFPFRCRFGWLAALSENGPETSPPDLTPPPQRGIVRIGSASVMSGPDTYEQSMALALFYDPNAASPVCTRSETRNCVTHRCGAIKRPVGGRHHHQGRQ